VSFLAFTLTLDQAGALPNSQSPIITEERTGDKHSVFKPFSHCLYGTRLTNKKNGPSPQKWGGTRRGFVVVYSSCFSWRRLAARVTLADVRSGSFASVCRSVSHFRFTPVNRPH
jgi:hypothetical protein